MEVLLYSRPHAGSGIPTVPAKEMWSHPHEGSWQHSGRLNTEPGTEPAMMLQGWERQVPWTCLLEAVICLERLSREAVLKLKTEQRSLLASVGAGPGWAVLLCRGSRHPLQTQDKKGAVFWLSKAMLTVCVGSWGKFEKMMPIPASGHNVSTITWPQIVFLKLSASYWIRLNLGIREIINYLIFLVNRFKAKAFCIIQNESRLCSI